LLSDFTVDFNNPKVQFKYLSLMFKCFGFVFNQNLKTHVLLEEQTETLKEQAVTLSLQNDKLLIKLEKIESELEERKRLEQLAEERRLKRRNRKKGFQRVY
jgi:transcriptional regulator GlxA family with amidase domain